MFFYSVCCLFLPRSFRNDRQTQQKSIRIIITINQVYQYEITKEQFESIRGSWDSLTAEGVLEIARQIVPPEQIPSRVTNIGIRAVPKNSAEGTLPVYRLIRKKILQRIMILLFRRAFCCGIREVRKW